jgi:small-conductance mechanosensitive channel
MDIKIIETGIAILAYFLLRGVAGKWIDRTVATHLMQKTRAKIIKKAINLLLLVVILVLIFIVWGVNQSELAVFIGSFLAVLGVGLVAQWSILSNITAGLIIFFNHPVKIDDTVTIIDKDYQVEGRVSDIGLFFVILKNQEGEQIAVPSTVFVQKMIKKKLPQS